MASLRPWQPEGIVSGSRGSTLMEVIVSLGITTLAIAMVVTSVYQALSVQRSWRDDVLATKEWRHAGSLFVGDALNAQTTDLVDGAPPATSVSLSWTDKDSVPHTATYTLSGADLIRDVDGNQMVLARRVVSAGFSLAGRIVSLDLEVQADSGTTESAHYRSYLRMLGI